MFSAENSSTCRLVTNSTSRNTLYIFLFFLITWPSLSWNAGKTCHVTKFQRIGILYQNRLYIHDILYQRHNAMMIWYWKVLVFITFTCNTYIYLYIAKIKVSQFRFYIEKYKLTTQKKILSKVCVAILIHLL